MAFGGLKGFLEAAANSITNPFAATGSVAVGVGDLVFAVLGEQTTLTITAVADNLGNTYSAVNAGTVSGAVTGRAFYSRVTVAGTLTSVSATTTASGDNVAFVAAVIEGPFAVGPLDTAPANTTADITTPFTCPATGTLAQAREVVMAWCVADGSAVWTASAPNLLVRTLATQSILHTIIGYQAVNATTTVSPAFAGTNPTVIVLGTASFKQDLTQPQPGFPFFQMGWAQRPAVMDTPDPFRRNVALLEPPPDVVTRPPYFQPRVPPRPRWQQAVLGSPAVLLATVTAAATLGGLSQQQTVLAAWQLPPPPPQTARNLEPPISGPAAADVVTRAPYFQPRAPQRPRWQQAALGSPAALLATIAVADNPPFVGGAAVRKEILVGWLPPPPRPPSARNLVPPTGPGPVLSDVVTRTPYFQPRIPRQIARQPAALGSPAALLAAPVGTLNRSAVVIQHLVTPAQPQQFQPLGSPAALLAAIAVVDNPPFTGGARVPHAVLVGWLPPSPRPPSARNLPPPTGPAAADVVTRAPYFQPRYPQQITRQQQPVGSPVGLLATIAVVDNPPFVGGARVPRATLVSWLRSSRPITLPATITASAPDTPRFTRAQSSVLVAWSWLPPASPITLPASLAISQAPPLAPPVAGPPVTAAVYASWAPQRRSIQLAPALVFSTPPPTPDQPPGAARMPAAVVHAWASQPRPIQLATTLATSGPAPQNPPFVGGARVPTEVLVGWLPPPPRPPAAINLEPPISGPVVVDNPPFAKSPHAALVSWLPPAPLPQQTRNIVPPISGPDNPPFVGGAQVSQAALIAWLPPPPRPPAAINLEPPISGPDAPPIVGARVPVAAQVAWLPPPPRSQSTISLVPPISGPDNPPIAGGARVPTEVLVGWLPPPPRSQSTVNLEPPISGPTPQNPPFVGGARVPQEVLIGWLPPPPRPPSAAITPQTGSPPQNPPIAGGARVPDAVLIGWLPPPPRPPSAAITPQAGPTPQNPPVAGGARIPPEVLTGWLPPPPRSQSAINLEPPISGPDNPPFVGGARVPTEVLVGWLPPPPRPPAAINLEPPISGPDRPPVAQQAVPLAVYAAWAAPAWAQPALSRLTPSGPDRPPQWVRTSADILASWNAPASAPLPQQSPRLIVEAVAAGAPAGPQGAPLAVYAAWVSAGAPQLQQAARVTQGAAETLVPPAGPQRGLLAIYASWQAVGYRTQTPRPWLSISGPAPQNPPIIGARVPQAVLVGWIPPPPQPPTGGPIAWQLASLSGPATATVSDAQVSTTSINDGPVITVQISDEGGNSVQLSEMG
jgi:hypothetical protein